MLCEAAHQASRKNNPLKPQFSRLCAKHGYKPATIAIAHRLLRIIYAMLRDGRPFELERITAARPPPKRRPERTYILRRPTSTES